MASIRVHERIAAPADTIWAIVSDAGAIDRWFPGIEESSLEGDIRTCRIGADLVISERIITNDPKLRRFQYGLVGGPLPFDEHRATVDVIDLGDESLVIYSTDVLPDAAADLLGPMLESAVASLKEKALAEIQQ